MHDAKMKQYEQSHLELVFPGQLTALQVVASDPSKTGHCDAISVKKAQDKAVSFDHKVQRHGPNLNSVHLLETNEHIRSRDEQNVADGRHECKIVRAKNSLVQALRLFLPARDAADHIETAHSPSRCDINTAIIGHKCVQMQRTAKKRRHCGRQ